MGLEMYLSQSQGQARSTKTMCQSYKQNCDSLQLAVDGFLNSANVLKGEAFDSARAHYTNILLPLVKGAELMLEIAESEVNQFPEDFVSQVCGTDLKEEDLLARIQEQNEAIATLNKMQTDLASSDLPDEDKSEQRKTNADLLKDHHATKRALEELLQKFREFNAYSTSIFSKLAEIENLMNTGFGQADMAWDAQTGRFNKPNNMDWATALNTKYEVKDLTPEEKEFIQNLQDQYGFDVETAKQVLEVKKKIDEKFPKQSQKEKDYLLNRILGDFVYGEDKGYVGGSMWEATAGSLRDFVIERNKSIKGTKASDILKSMGMDEKDIAKLRYNIRLQNALAPGRIGDYDSLSDADKSSYKSSAESIYGSMTDEQFKEFWNKKQQSYSGKNDFAHQSITTATMLYDNPFRAPNILYGDEGTNELAGWRGDTTITPAAKDVSMGNDDYKADLDAVNITDIMKEKGMSYVEASNYYYNHLEEKADSTTTNYTRAEKFKNHASLDHVKSTIFDNLVPKEWKPSASGSNQNPGHYVDRSEEESMAYLKEHYPDSYNFIRSLEENDTNLGDYANKE